MRRLLIVALAAFVSTTANAQTLTQRPVSQGAVTPADMTERLPLSQCWPASPTQQITRLCSAAASVLSELI